MLHQGHKPRQGAWKHEGPNLYVVMVLDNHPRAACPKGRQKRYAIPNLHESISAPMTAHQLSKDAAGKDLIAPGSTHHLDTFTSDGGGPILHLGGSDKDIQAGSRPTASHLG